jgi:hypothetical protein
MPISEINVSSDVLPLTNLATASQAVAPVQPDTTTKDWLEPVLCCYITQL